jgi:hypothetical protein
MGVAYREDGFRFSMWSNDHEPPHVHAYNGDGEAVIEIRTLVVRRYVGMKPKDVAKAVWIVAEQAEMLLEQWRRLHGS